MNTIFMKRYSEDFPINKREIWRYAGVKGTPDGQLQELLDTVIADLKGKLSYRVCYRKMQELPFGKESKDLAKSLKGCKQVIVFAATIGLELDRYIAKFQHVSANAFCKEMAGCTKRFSPGYGDLPLETQKDIFALLDCGKYIGVSLNESLLMMPSKSVTAIFGIGSAATEPEHKCENCDANCDYRR